MSSAAQGQDGGDLFASLRAPKRDISAEARKARRGPGLAESIAGHAEAREQEARSAARELDGGAGCDNETPDSLAAQTLREVLELGWPLSGAEDELEALRQVLDENERLREQVNSGRSYRETQEGLPEGTLPRV